MKSEVRFTLMDPRDRGFVAARLRRKRKNAIPTNYAQIYLSESEGGMTAPLELRDMRVIPDSA